MTTTQLSENTTNSQEIDVWLEEYLSGLLEHTGLDVWVSEMDIDDNSNTYTIQLDGKDKSRAIGRDGQMLESLQHLCVASAANRGFQDARIVIDVDGYRHRRDEKLKTDTQEIARSVLSTTTPYSMEPMGARERRFVHMIVSQINGVTSESHGSGSERHVRIVLKSQTP